MKDLDGMEEVNEFVNRAEDGSSDGKFGAESSNTDLSEAAENTVNSAEDDSAGVYILKKPFTAVIDDVSQTITKINYDFGSVRPIQYKNLVARLSRKGQIAVPELDNNVQFGYFALACGIPASELMRMPNTQDYTVICAMVRNFLLGVSAMENEEE